MGSAAPVANPTKGAALAIACAPDAQAQFDYQEQALRLVGSDPTAGLYSETEAAKGTQLSTKAEETRADIVLGRKPLSAWKDFLAGWKSGGGDKIRAEYQDGFQQPNG